MTFIEQMLTNEVIFNFFTHQLYLMTIQRRLMRLNSSNTHKKKKGRRHVYHHATSAFLFIPYLKL